MAERSLSDQLNDAVEALLAHPEAAPAGVDARLAPLVRIAASLLDLPREEFRARLKDDLQRRARMATHTVKPIREGFHTITPYLTVPEVAGLVDFVKQAFGAEELFRHTIPSGTHCEVRIGDSILMLGGRGAGHGPARLAAIHLYVDDADTVYRRALEAGAVSLHPPTNQPYGDREGSVKDPYGNHWYIATHLGATKIPPGLHTVTPYLHPRGAAQLIDFLKRAFHAEEIQRHSSPDGTVMHAKVRIGDSIVEMGEAHAQWQPMQTMFYMYVDDADAVYRQALEAGAESFEEPADQPYGDRRAGVNDPFGNMWGIATHIKDVSL